MRLSDETHATVKNRVLELFDPGKVLDILLELSTNAFDEECIRVRMFMDKTATADDFKDLKLIDIQEIVFDSLDDELKDLVPPVIEIKKADD